MTPEQLMDLAIQFRTAPAPKEPKPKKLTIEQRRQAIRDQM